MSNFTARRLAFEKAEKDKSEGQQTDSPSEPAADASKEGSPVKGDKGDPAAAADPMTDEVVEPPTPTKKAPGELELPPSSFLDPTESELLDPNAPTAEEKAEQINEQAMKEMGAEKPADPADELKASMGEMLDGKSKATMAEQSQKIRAASAGAAL